MKVRNLLLPGLFALALFVSACLPVPELRNENFLNDDSLYTNEPCEVPCWRGIIPGETSWDDALIIVEDSQDLEDPEIQTAEDGPAVGAQWRPVNGEPCCQMVSEDGETVSVILLQFAPNHTLGELIETHGEPEYAIGTPGNEEQAIVNVFYPDKALIGVIFVAGPTNGELRESSEVIGAYYLTHEQMDLILRSSTLYAWKGFEPYSAYAPDAENADFALTPEPTAEATAEETEEAGAGS